MKALLITAAFATLSTVVLAETPRSQQEQDATSPATVVADAGHLGAATLTALDPAAPLTGARRGAGSGNPFEALTDDIDPGTALLGLGVLALVVSRFVGRLARRQEQHRRATALASTLDHAHRG